MRQLLPVPAADVDPAAAHAAAARPAPEGRPWVLANMVASADGATAVEGRSEGLGGPADKAVFSALRSVADVILVAAGTARAESYGPPRTPADRRAEREARGQAPYPRLALVTRSLDLDPTSAMFTEATAPPVVFTVTSAPTARRQALDGLAEIVDVGDDGVDLAAALGWLADRGVATVLCEGGPSLNGQLLAAGLVDELDLTTSPLLVGGDSARAAHGPDGEPLDVELAHLWEADGVLFARYVRA
ncbi:pyrimidine reductase family protein [Aquihabitans sp. G128]|uniref:pyrimidine reductase family protein n=1 Tax=Aquihabitans sp. G128 TaxID=2849779 RepID=UPI001C237084|nr:pyrimidine reductase family protein [Aquihabitans sp. G128]QXC62490.1 pyrimidine reductase family protein [Aquihabitans sp. G128]